MSYDGHGRLYQSHKPEQRDGSNNLKYTTYTYNLDDTVATQTDGRGVVTSYIYNSRALVTNIGWNVGGTGVTDPTDVTFTYDNLGNRTQMTDGLGQVDYSYSELSQMIDETRDFTDTLVDAPISGDKFKLEYAYTLSGGLKSYKDPYGQEIDYTHDKTGRLSTVTGTSFGGVTSYAATPTYRAWGGLKHLDYGNAAEINITYNDKLQAASFELKKSTTVLMKDNYEYHQSGEMKTVDNEVASKFDNLFKYDHAGRTVAARSAVEAGGSTETDLTQLPFRQDFGYDAFNHMTEFEGTRWTDGENEPYTYVNNRKWVAPPLPPYSYDDDGRDISGRSIDAAGAVVWQAGVTDVVYTRYYQGDGQEIKRGYSHYDPELEEMTEPKHAYFIYSSVLNTIVSEANETGKKTQTFVLAEGAIVALQKIAYPSVTEYVVWEHRDAGDTQVAYTDASGAATGGVGWSAGSYDAIGRQTGSMSFVNPAPAQKPISPFFESPEQLGSGFGCQQTVDGISQPCGMATADSATPSHIARYSHLPGFRYENRGMGLFSVTTGVYRNTHDGTFNTFGEGEKVAFLHSSSWNLMRNRERQPLQQKDTYPCPPTITQLKTNSRVIKALDDAFSNSGHRTDSPLEAGGWIYQDTKGNLIFRSADASRRQSGSINLANPPNIANARVVATYHSHPYRNQDYLMRTNVDGKFGVWDNTGPSFEDRDLATARGFPGLVIYEAMNESKTASQIWRSGVGPIRAGSNPEQASDPQDGFPGNSLDTRKRCK